MAYIPPDERNDSDNAVYTQAVLEAVSNQTLPLEAIPQGMTIVGGDFISPNYAKGLKGWKLSSDGSAEFNAGVTTKSLDIPDKVTASSFHVDVNGNAWWGATTFAAALASIADTGNAIFKSILVGGLTKQYTIGDNGVYSFGDGSDGTGVADGSTTLAGASLAGSIYTLTRDVYYTDLTVSTGVTVKPSGYRIFCNGTLTLNGTGTISGNGNDGSNGGNAASVTGGSGGGGGAALADGYLKGSLAGTAGANGVRNAAGNNSVGNNGTNPINSLGKNGVQGGSGGTGGGNGGGSPGNAGTITASNVKLIANWHLMTLLDISSTGATVKFDNSAGATGGASGGDSGAGTNASGGGGGAGSAGRVVAIYAKSIVVGASASITCNGGKGGNGGAIFTGGGQTGGSGGGGGGNGGVIILVYNMLTNSGTISANGGVKGTAGTGTGGASGTSGNDGSVGNAGTIYQFALSL